MNLAVFAKDEIEFVKKHMKTCDNIASGLKDIRFETSSEKGAFCRHGEQIARFIEQEILSKKRRLTCARITVKVLSPCEVNLLLLRPQLIQMIAYIEKRTGVEITEGFRIYAEKTKKHRRFDVFFEAVEVFD